MVQQIKKKMIHHCEINKFFLFNEKQAEIYAAI